MIRQVDASRQLKVLCFVGDKRESWHRRGEVRGVYGKRKAGGWILMSAGEDG